MKLFLSYGAPADQVTALRLQALGAANGLTVYVPPAHTRTAIDSSDPHSSQKLSESEIVLGLVGNGLTPACNQELSTAMATGKELLIMESPQFSGVLQPVFGESLVLIDPAKPYEFELAIVEHLKQLDAQQGAKRALLALGTLVLGLLLLAPAEQS